MKQIWNVSTKLVSGKTLASADTVTNTASVARDHNLFNFIKYFQCCWEIFKEDFKDAKNNAVRKNGLE